METLPPELINLFQQYLDNRDLYALILVHPWKFNTLSKKEWFARKYQSVEEASWANDLDGVKFIHEIRNKGTLQLKTGKIFTFLEREGMKILQNYYYIATNWATYHGNLKLLKYLCGMGKNCKGQTLEIAIRSKHFHIIDYLRNIQKIPYSRWTTMESYIRGYVIPEHYVEVLQRGDIDQWSLEKNRRIIYNRRGVWR